ncbi:unnamed protein product [Effrenium voratum]|uniref:BTB domain-containing protein n=1 Tax=Effrenium voratum TaxID=2562239 RepID=A0AA36N9A5_9DINO|nr:unnamed protein product [Effrenium voratum]
MGEEFLVRAANTTSFDWQSTHPHFGSAVHAILFGRIDDGQESAEEDIYHYSDIVLATEVSTKQRLNLLKFSLENGASPDIVAPESCIRCLSWRWFEKDEWTEDVIPAGKSGVETLLAVKRALLKSESTTPKAAVHKKIQDVDKALVTLFSSDQRLESPKATVPEELLEMWARLLADSSTADLRICISGSTGEVSELNAHSVVLRAASPVLNAMLSGCMQEASGRVSVENVSLAAAKVLLSLMYTGSLPLDLDAQSTVVLEAMCLAHRWQVQYVVHILVSAAEKALTPETFEPTADCAIRLQLPELLAICRSFANARKRASAAVPPGGKPQSKRRRIFF